MFQGVSRDLAEVFDFTDSLVPGTLADACRSLPPIKPPAVVAVPAKNTRWVRPADQAEWHLVRGPDLGVREPVCGLVGFVRQPGEASLAPDRAHVFGPVCATCALQA